MGIRKWFGICAAALGVFASGFAVSSEKSSSEPSGGTAGYAGAFILDVRTGEEFAAGHLQGAVNIPYDVIEQNRDALPENTARRIVVYCRSGRRSAIAASTLQKMGYTNLSDLGSMENAAAKTTLKVMK